MHLPGLKVVTPSTPYEAKVCSAQLYMILNPVCFIEHKLLYKTKGEVPEETTKYHLASQISNVLVKT